MTVNYILSWCVFSSVWVGLLFLYLVGEQDSVCIWNTLMLVHSASLSSVCCSRTSEEYFFPLHSSLPKTFVCEIRLIQVACMNVFCKMQFSRFQDNIHSDESLLPDADKTPEICLDFGCGRLKSLMNRQVTLTRAFSIPQRPPGWLGLSSRLRYSLLRTTTALCCSWLLCIITVNIKQLVRPHHLVELLSLLTIYLLSLFWNDLFCGSLSLKASCKAVHWIHNILLFSWGKLIKWIQVKTIIPDWFPL